MAHNRNVASLLFFCAALSTHAQAPAYTFDVLWPSLPQPWFFKRPLGVAVDERGNFYAGDTYNNRLHKFTVDGQLISVFGNTKGQFVFPTGVDTDADGTLYVATSGGYQTYDPNGAFLFYQATAQQSNGEAFTASDVAVTPGGAVYVTRQDRFLIQQYDADRSFVREWGDVAAEERPIPIGWLPSVDVGPDGSIYATDLGDISDGNNVDNFTKNMVKRFSPEGDLLDEWGAAGAGPGQFHVAFGIATNNTGEVYVADVFNGRIQKFTAEGEFLLLFPRPDSEDFIAAPSGVAVDDIGNVYVTSSDADQIQKYTGGGVFLNQWSAFREFAFPFAADIGASGNVYVADTLNNQIKIFTSSGELIREWGNPGQNGGPPGTIYEPQGILADEANGVVYVSDTEFNRVEKFTLAGEFVLLWGSDSNGFPIGNGEDDTSTPLGLALDSAGFVYVVESSNYRVHKFNANGEHVAFWGEFGTGPGQFNGPTDVAIDASDNVYVTDASNYRVQVFTTVGEYVREWGEYGEGLPDELHGVQFDEPSGIDVDPAGNVYVVDFQNDRAQYFTGGGEFLGVIGGPGDDPGQFSRPNGVAAGDTGQLVVVDTGHQRVQSFRPIATPGKGTPVDTRRRKFIIIAGGGPEVDPELWRATGMLANFAYLALLHQGADRESIYYLSRDSTQDLDNNPETIDVDAETRLSDLETAFDWAADAVTVIVYMTGPGGDDEFFINPSEVLGATALGDLFDNLQAKISGSAGLLYDASGAASFLDDLVPPEGRIRVLCMSTGAGEGATFATDGTLSFSYLFWSRVFNGASFLTAYHAAESAVLDLHFQTPVLDVDGDGIGNQPGDGGAKQLLDAFAENDRFDARPSIGDVSPPRALGLSERVADFAAEGVIDDRGRIARVWAIVQRPADAKAFGARAITALPTFDLLPTDDGTFESSYGDFDAPGEYAVNIHALDENLNVSAVRTTTVTKGIVPASITGLVFGPSGPVAGASVELVDVSAPVAADAEGLFSFPALSNGEYTVRVTHPGYETEERIATIANGNGVAVNFEMSPIPGEGEGEGDGEGEGPVCAAANAGPRSVAIGDMAVLCAVTLLLLRQRGAT